MIQLKVRLRRSEIKPFSEFINKLISMNKDRIDTTEYYNLISFCKKLLDKSYKLLFSTKDKIDFKIDLNVSDALIYIYNINCEFMDEPENVYYKTIFQAINFDLLKQKENLPKFHQA